MIGTYQCSTSLPVMGEECSVAVWKVASSLREACVFKTGSLFNSALIRELEGSLKKALADKFIQVVFGEDLPRGQLVGYDGIYRYTGMDFETDILNGSVLLTAYFKRVGGLPDEDARIRVRFGDNPQERN